MSIFFKIFNKKISEVWKLANSLDKPVSDRLSWAVGLINGRGDFKDLQAHGAALMASIIINEDVVPRIICAWDTSVPISRRKKSLPIRKKQYPLFLLNLFEDYDESFIEGVDLRKCASFKNKFVNLQRSGWSVIPYPGGLGIGYRAKYLGLNWVQTPHTILSDIDTICAEKCCGYIQDEIDKDPNTFCLTNHFDQTDVSVGLIAFNMKKYREIYLPHWHEAYWELPHADAKHIQFIRTRFPECKDDLDLRLVDKNFVNTERYFYRKPRKNDWVENKSAHYHAWKGEMRKQNAFMEFYDNILDGLIQRAKEQQ